MWKRIKITIFIMFIFNIVLFCGNPAIASGFSTVDDSLQNANDYLKAKLRYPGNFFEKESQKRRPIYPDLAIRGNAAFGNVPVFVYQTEALGSEEASKYGNDTRRYDSNGNPRALGFSFTDDPYANPGFHIDNVTYVHRWIKEPWNLPLESQGGITKQLSPDDSADTHRTQWLEYQPHTFASTYSVINQWIVSKDFLPNKVQEKTGNRKFFNDSIEGPLPRGIQSNPEDYIYIIQPPTNSSWGIGIGFYYYGGTGADNMSQPNYYSYYQYFRLKPLAEDLAASFETLPLSAEAGENVQVGIKVKSTFESELANVAFGWEIINKTTNTPVTSTFSGHGPAGEGAVGSIPANGEVMLYANFTMPDSDVRVKFAINKEGRNPAETNLDNNVLDSDPNAVKLKTIVYDQHDLPFNVLSRDVEISNSVTANLILPKGWWVGNATGSLNVNNDTPEIYRDCRMADASYNINEPNTTITRTPVVSAAVKREAFGDDPLNHHWKNPDDPGKPEERTGKISYNGSVSREYEYPVGEGATATGIASAAFQPGGDQRKYKTDIYNGMKNEDMPQVADRDFKKVVENNYGSSLLRKLFWISDPYNLDVIRWMCHLDENEREYGWTEVDGQYQRTFTQQNTADITWAITHGMKSLYDNDRENARNKRNGKQYYPNAVFPTDRDLQRFDYPVKSGYYYKPLGEYTCTVTTVQYKNNTNNTSEHAELVNKLKNAFHYQSSLQYTSDGRNRETLDITNAGDSVFGVKVLNIQTASNKDCVWLEHTTDSTGRTHNFFKEILEGYDESNTIDSENNFKYREYIKNQDIYKVTETTVITFRIAPPPGQKLYTYVNMKNGDYGVNVWVEGISLANYRYSGLALEKVDSVDSMTVTVRGSMYDDVNN